MHFSLANQPRVARVLIAVAALVIVFFCGYVVRGFLHVCQNPAPLGRTDGEVARTLAHALPNGVSLDSASAYLSGAGVQFAIERSNRTPRADHARDTNSVGGPVVDAMERSVVRDFFVSTDIQVRLYFDSAGRLARRDIHSVYTGP